MVSKTPELPESNIAELADGMKLVVLEPEHLQAAAITIRDLVESGTEVIAATPFAVQVILKLLEDE